MSIAVGKENLGIENPFKNLGRLLLLLGLIGLAAAAYLVHLAWLAFAEEAVVTAAFRASAALLVALLALRLFWSGLLRSLRFYVGRNVPASLSEEKDEHDGAPKSATGDLAPSYPYEEIERMLDGKEIAYRIPKTLTIRLLYSLFPRLLYTPPPVRRFGENAFIPTLYAGVLAVLFAALFAVHQFGLYPLADPAVLHGTAALYGLLIARRWLTAFRPADVYGQHEKGLRLRRRGLLLALLVPVVLEGIVRSQAFALPPFPVFAQLLLYTALGASAALFLVATLLIYHRVPKVQLSYAASDERVNWEEDTHPADLFRIFSQIMLELRRLDIPNRCYFNQLKLSSGIGHSQTAEKGIFEGKITQETQPLARAPARHGDRAAIDKVLVFASAVGAAAIAIGFAGAAAFGFGFQAPSGAAPGPAVFEPAIWILSFAIVVITGEKILLGVVQFFRSELTFESQLLLFRGNGSFRTTRLTTGAGFTDSQRSESDLINSSFSVRLISCNLVSSVFVKPARHAPFDTGRYVVELEHPGNLSKNILHSIHEFLRGRRKMSTFTSRDDSEVVDRFSQLNKPPSGEVVNLLNRREPPPPLPPNPDPAAGHARPSEPSANPPDPTPDPEGRNPGPPPASPDSPPAEKSGPA